MFDNNSTTNDVLSGADLAGKRVFITGVSAGLGVETARACVAHGATVIGAARDLAKAREAGAVVFNAGAGSYELVELDLASLASVRACADALIARGEPLDVIIANAGRMASPFSTTADGFESQFGTNHLGHFLLINRIAPLLRKDGRVVVLSSNGHRVADVDLDDFNFDKTPYDPIVAYGRSKSANALFAVEFDRRYKDREIRATSLHPGGIRTELMRYMTPETFQNLVETSKRMAERSGMPLPGLKTVEQGAATSVWAAFKAPADEIGGRFCTDCHVGVVADETGKGEVSPHALNPERAKALWALSEKLVGESFSS